MELRLPLNGTPPPPPVARDWAQGAAPPPCEPSEGGAGSASEGRGGVACAAAEGSVEAEGARAPAPERENGGLNTVRVPKTGEVCHVFDPGAHTGRVEAKDGNIIETQHLNIESKHQLKAHCAII